MFEDYVEETVRLADREVALLRPPSADELIDEDAFDEDEFLPYWAELWPSGLALARTVAELELDGLRVLELGAGLGLPSLAAALRGADVLATDWADDAVALLRENAARNGLALEAIHADWRSFDGTYDLALAADVLYEARNVGPLAELLPRLAPSALVGLAGRRHESEFLRLVETERVAERVVRIGA